LDGLKLFFNVYEVFLVSSNSKIAGEAIYIAHKLEVAVVTVGGISAQVLDHPTVWGVGLSGH
jgi:hypothetical protein